MPNFGYRPTLRRRVLLVVTFVALSPVIFIALSVPYERVLEWWMVDRMVEATRDLPPSVDDSALASMLEDREIWGRVVRGDEVTGSYPFGVRPIDINLAGIAEPDARNWFRTFDSERVPVPERSVVKAAMADGEAASTCGLGRDERLLVCSLAAPIATSSGPAILYLTSANVRNVRALTDSAVVQLTYQVLLVALLVGLWLSRRVLKPVESLREQVRDARDRPPATPTPSITVEDDTEIGELAVEFDSLLKLLDERRRGNEAFAADLAHELKNPVAAIQSCADNIEAGMTHAEQLDRYAGVLQRSSARLQHLIDQFLELARAEAGLEQAERDGVDVALLIERVCAQLLAEPRFEGRRIEVEAEPARIDGARGPLQTAFEKVVENALEVTEPATGKVAVTVKGGDEVVVSVSDDGPGLSAGEQARVFDRFFSRRAGGTGLGLPIAKAVAQAHGGDLAVASNEGSGATFTFRLPSGPPSSHDSHVEVTEE